MDQLIGMIRSDAFPADFGSGPPAAYRIHLDEPKAIMEIPFATPRVAWECMWHNVRNGTTAIARDSAGNAVGYALYKRETDNNGVVSHINLLQCAVAPDRSDRDSLYRALLSQVFGPLDVACVRRTSDLSMSDHVLIDLLKELGFETIYEQYLMVVDKNRLESSGER